MEGEMFNLQRKKCPQCQVDNRQDARFCRKCGFNFDQAVETVISKHHWFRKPEDFAVRIDAGDLPGILRHGLIIEPGTNALLVERGANAGIVPPGSYVLENAGQNLWNWLTTGIPEQATVLLVDITPVDLDFHLGGRFTSDPLPIGLSIRMRAEISDAGKFLVNVLKGEGSFSLENLRQMLYPEVVQAADSWLSRHLLIEMVENTGCRGELELAIEEDLRMLFQQSGLRLLNIRTVELNLEPIDEINKIRGQKQLLVYRAAAEDDLKGSQVEIEQRRAQADSEAHKRFSEIKHQIDLHALIEETRKVEIEERKIEIYQRMRKAVMSDRMNETRTEADFDIFLDQMDRQKLLREKERIDLFHTWKDEGEDRDRARAKMLARLEAAENYEMRMLEIKNTSELKGAAQDAEIDLARKRMDWEIEQKQRLIQQEFELERSRVRIAQEREDVELQRQHVRNQSLADQRKIELGSARDSANLAQDILDRIKEARRVDREATLRIERLDEEERLRIQRVHTIELQRAELENELKRREADERKLQTERDFELRRIEEMGKLGAEALIALTGPQQANILAEIKKMEIFKGMSEEQIMALNAKDSTFVAQALAEKYRAIAEGKATQHEQELYERLLGDQKTTLQILREENDKRAHDISEMSRRSQENSEISMRYMSETAQAFARNASGPSIVVTPAGGSSQVISNGQMNQNPQKPNGEQKICIQCGKMMPDSFHFCPHCGNRFEGVS
jgi:hypothetical protein